MGAEDGSIENGPERKEDAVDEVAVANASESEDPHETLLRTGVEGETSISSLDADDTAVLKAGWELPPDSNETMGSNALRTITASDDWLGEEIRKKETLRKRLQRLCAVFGWLIFIFLGAWAVFYVVFMVFVSKVDNLDADDWGYSFEKNAPPEWANLGEANSECVSTAQSPISISVSDSLEQGSSAFADLSKVARVETGKFEVESVAGRGPVYRCLDDVDINGETITSCGILSWKTVTYYLYEVRAHVPGEHVVSGESLAFEMQYFFQNEDETLRAAISTLYNAFNVHNFTALNPLWFSRLNETTRLRADERTIENIQLNSLIDLNSGYFQYTGSDTIPPCAENVEWFIQTNLFSASLDQVSAFRKSIVGYPGNRRPPQPLNGRVITLYGEAEGLGEG
mmetsp:Transcript_5251/g.22341  ORF Transcript_5251/g.22341 Transcript_5251/m.22341 type:complete len:399 (-) Transcript_5251:526-1722(-)|eukprot:CAMPEP_0113971928 /NCGR_PEP_ID=MMETSP0011_2-20120614/12782_1 /TAXON_ID=101924 /ORGANISM="Rhodosorus marinus" /LENGTH=398 /DNA_ID=CAMNT_0000988025 /DNA_START=178 /DNA_END=1374 /DNA_ORIENTATION=+ /assembly_acc=CAM_ASM_000156